MTNEKGIIYIARVKGRIDSLKNYDIYIDGIKKGKIASGEVFSRKLPAGNYKIQIGLDWYKTVELDVQIKENKTSYMSCESNIRGVKISNLFKVFGGEKGIIAKSISEERISKIVQERNDLTDKKIVELAINASCGVYDEIAAAKDTKIQGAIFGILAFLINIGSQLIFVRSKELLFSVINAALFGLIIGMIYYLFSKSKTRMWSKETNKNK
ncbi:MAG: hypothetical protein ACRC41_14835 [Sarcina sp.]